MPMPVQPVMAALCVAAAMFGAIAASVAPTGAAEATNIRVNTFPNAKALPVYVGIAKGFFAKYGLAVEQENTESSQSQRDGLVAGKFQIAHAALDNAVAMIEVAKKDVVIVSGGDSGMNEFFVQRGIAGFAQLRGRTILVDAPDTAYALQVRKLMAAHGVAAGEYTIKPAGASPYRFKAMVADAANAAAILNPPFTVQAKALGMTSLGNTVELLGPYQAVGVFVMRPWAEENRDALTRFLAAEIEALRYVRDPAHRADSIALLTGEDKLAADVAARTYDELVDPAFGFTPDARLDMAGFRNMLALRAEVEGKPPVPPERTLDLSDYARALELVGR
jgi:ABC-type nitrate/sulfonate/bicarbonate transport system substrate-binding protein